MKSIEEEILQTKPFANQNVRALVNMIYTCNILFDDMNEVLKVYDLSYQQFNVLRIVAGAEVEVSTAYIKKRMLVKNCDSSRLVDRMVGKGLLEKQRSEHDARLIKVTLTNHGQSILDQINEQDFISKNQIQNLSSEECETLNNLLNKIRVKI